MSNKGIINVNSLPTVTSRGGKIKVFASPTALGSTKVIMGVATLGPGQEISEHVHDYGEEAVLVLKGTGGVQINNTKHIIKKGDSFLVKQGEKHRVYNQSSNDLELVFASAPLAPSNDKGHRDIKETKLEKVNGINLAFNEIGQGEACFMLHGNRDSKELFSELAEKISKTSKLRVFTIDFRGHGQSDKPDSEYSIDVFVEDIACFARQKGLGNFTLVGHSLGSTVSMMLAAKYPKMVNKLILMGSAATFAVKFERPLITADNYKEMVQVVNDRATPFFFTDGFDEVRNKVLSNWSKVDFEVHKNLVKLRHPDLNEVAQQIKNETLIICGKKDKATTPADAEYLHKLIKGSELSVIDGAGHFMYVEKPLEVSREISKFIER